MPFLTQGKTNIVYILIVVIVAVIIGGVVFWHSMRQEVPYQPPEPQEPVEVDETAGWQTYRNEEYGFEIKYPENWSADITDKSFILLIAPDSNLVVGSPEYGQIIAIKASYGSYSSFQSNMGSYYNFYHGPNYYEPRENVKISSFQIGEFEVIVFSIKISESTNSIRQRILIYPPERMSEKEFIWFRINTNKEKFDNFILNKLLPTLKFFEPTESPKLYHPPATYISKGVPSIPWKTYRSEEFGFRFDYPGSWEIKESTGDEFLLRIVVNPLFLTLRTGSLSQYFSIKISLIEKRDSIVSAYNKYGITPEEKILIGEMEGVKFRFKGFKGVEGLLALIEKGGYLYDFEGPCCAADEDKLFNQMLSTFRFLE